MFELAIILWLACGIGAAATASNRGANGCLWFGLGVLFGPFGLIFSFMSGDEQVRCPSCRSMISEKATRCPRCQASITGPTEA